MNQQVFETLLSEVCKWKYSDNYGGIVVTKIFKDTTPCEWGGLGKGCRIESRQHKEIDTVRQTAHWRHKCSHCKAYVNPKTGERAMLQSTEQIALRQFYDCVKPKN